jgi:membrane protease YdiL (CAAX protease family)
MNEKVITEDIKTSREITSKTLRLFFAITFGLCWGLGMLLVFFPQIERIFGPMSYTNPIFILMVWAPAIASMSLIARYYGIKALGSFFRRLFLWRMSVLWWLVLLVGIPAVFYLGATIKGEFPAQFPFAPWYAVIPALATALVIGPVEEFGWRGMALPLLQRKYTPFVASIMLGTVWAVWHLPSFFMSGTPQSSWSFGFFFLGVIAIALILTQMFNASKGSLFVAFLFHFMVNNPIWPDAQPWDSVFLMVVALVFVWVNRKTMFAREAGVTEVLMPGASVNGKRQI